MNPENNPTTEIDEAVQIARSLRKTILSGNVSLESSMHGLYTVAQILKRKVDLEWAEKEIYGYSKGDIFPQYRNVVFRRFYLKEVQISEWVNDHDINTYHCWDSISEIEHKIGTKESERARQYLVSEDAQEIIKKYGDMNISDIRWMFPNAELVRIISSVKLELIKKLNEIIGEITYGNIPPGIFKKFQTKVNEKLLDSNPEAISELNIAYESLGKSEDSERIAHVAFSCRRLVKAIADKLFVPQDKKYKMKSGNEIEVDEEHFLNRLEAYLDSLDSNNKRYLIRELKLLRDLMNEIPESINKGVHLDITNSGAERLVLYSYMILGDIILEEVKN